MVRLSHRRGWPVSVAPPAPHGWPAPAASRARMASGSLNPYAPVPSFPQHRSLRCTGSYNNAGLSLYHLAIQRLYNERKQETSILVQAYLWTFRQEAISMLIHRGDRIPMRSKKVWFITG